MWESPLETLNNHSKFWRLANVSWSANKLWRHHANAHGTPGVKNAQGQCIAAVASAQDLVLASVPEEWVLLWSNPPDTMFSPVKEQGKARKSILHHRNKFISSEARQYGDVLACRKSQSSQDYANLCCISRLWITLETWVVEYNCGQPADRHGHKKAVGPPAGPTI